MTAKQIYCGSVSLIMLILILAAVGDLVLHLIGEETITDWLRKSPRYYWWPVGLAVGLLIFSGWHIFVQE